MSDTTNPTAPGNQTTEAKSTRIIQVVFVCLAAVGAALGTLQTEFPDTGWIAAAAMLVGGGVTLGTQLGFLKSRTAIKATMIASGLPGPTVLGPSTTSTTNVKPNP